MCVVTLVRDGLARPTDDDVRAMWDHNPYGGGVAWREMRGDKPVVAFKKGLSKDEMVDFNHRLPAPYVLHFRIPSQGKDCVELLHPFPIQANAPLTLEGTIDDPVLFHNGTWNQWQEKGLNLAARLKVKVPGGQWSDTRAMAWLSFHFGHYILEWIDEKVLVFGPGDDDLDIYGQPWHEVRGFTCSNLWWESNLPKEAVQHQRPRSHQVLGPTGGDRSASGDAQDPTYVTPAASHYRTPHGSTIEVIKPAPGGPMADAPFPIVYQKWDKSMGRDRINREFHLLELRNRQKHSERSQLYVSNNMLKKAGHKRDIILAAISIDETNTKNPSRGLTLVDPRVELIH